MFAPSPHAHVDFAPALRADPPQGSRAAMAQRGIGPACKNGHHPAPLLGQLRAADGVHALADAVKAPAPKPMFDRRRAEAERQQIPTAQDSVLPARQLPRRRAPRIRPFPRHSKEKSERAESLPPSGKGLSRGGLSSQRGGGRRNRRCREVLRASAGRCRWRRRRCPSGSRRSPRRRGRRWRKR